jgi:hypothetical protein
MRSRTRPAESLHIDAPALIEDDTLSLEQRALVEVALSAPPLAHFAAAVDDAMPWRLPPGGQRGHRVASHSRRAAPNEGCELSVARHAPAWDLIDEIVDAIVEA